MGDKRIGQFRAVRRARGLLRGLLVREFLGQGAGNRPGHAA